MTSDQLDHLLTAANPLPADRARELPVADAQQELLAGIVAATRRRPRARRFAPRAALAVAATAAALVALAALADGPGHRGPATAWGAEQVRFAERSPLVLLGAAGWRIDYADEQSAGDGELHFRHRAPAPQDVNDSTPPRTDYAQLNWRPGSLSGWVDDRARSASVATTAPVLGTTAHVYQYEGGAPGHRDITALFRYDGRVLEFRAGAADISAFKALLATLKGVDTNAWLSAMPASVVKPTDRDRVIAQMLKDVTVPPGFATADIKGASLTKDRYQLGATVAGTVACQWFKRWADARASHDGSGERQAVAALTTARDWPILKEMAKDGAYPQVLFELVAAMPSGKWFGRPLIGAVNEGLGCATFGVELPKRGTGTKLNGGR
jgi:hypothetical protein